MKDFIKEIGRKMSAHRKKRQVRRGRFLVSSVTAGLNMTTLKKIGFLKCFVGR